MSFIVCGLILSAAAAPPAPALPNLPGAMALLDQIDATPAQRRALQAIASEVLFELDQVARHDALRIVDEVADALVAPTVDRVRLEGARRDAVDLVDRASSALLPRVAAAAEVLTPDQRGRAVDMMRREANRRLGLGNG